jgi:hypothetical protein
MGSMRIKALLAPIFKISPSNPSPIIPARLIMFISELTSSVLIVVEPSECLVILVSFSCKNKLVDMPPDKKMDGFLRM